MSLSKLKTVVDDYASKIQASEWLLPTYGYSEDGARPHVELGSDSSYFYVIIERGEELERHKCNTLDELLYIVFRSVTSEMAAKYEVANRIENQDFRRIMFKKRAELMIKLNPSWKDKIEKDHTDILSRNPFNDS